MPLRAFQRQLDPVAAEAWFAGPAGLAMLQDEAGCVAEALQSCSGQPTLWLGPTAVRQADPAVAALWLRPSGGGHWQGDVHCNLPLPLASDSCACVVVQHVAEYCDDPVALFQECSRILQPGGWLWLLALNPLSPYRLRWRGSGLTAFEPVTSRRRLRNAGLVPDAVTQGLGPTWKTAGYPGLQRGAGLRAAFLLRAQKRRLPVTPLRSPRVVMGWQPGATA